MMKVLKAFGVILIVFDLLVALAFLGFVAYDTARTLVADGHWETLALGVWLGIFVFGGLFIAIAQGFEASSSPTPSLLIPIRVRPRTKGTRQEPRSSEVDEVVV